MTWKSTVFVSGAGLLATWFASVPPPSSVPAAVAVSQPPAPSRGAADIARLADRLEERNRGTDDFSRPARNLFRFSARATRRPAPVPEAAPVAVNPPAPPPMPIHLSGVAMDRAGAVEVWTAILSTPAGVVIARAGDEVAGWTVTAVGPESATLLRPDGTPVTIPLSGK